VLLILFLYLEDHLTFLRTSNEKASYMGFANTDDIPLRSLLEIYNKNYSTRPWTVREMLLGKSHTCHLGLEQISIQTLNPATSAVCELARSRVSLPQSDDATDWSRLEHMCSYVSYAYLDPVMGQCDTIHDHASLVAILSRQACSNPRDYIYALVGLFIHPEKFLVDYSLSVAEVFVDFTVYCMQEDQDFKNFEYNRRSADRIVSDAHTDSAEAARVNDRSKSRPRVSGLPSWCPDWTMPRAFPRCIRLFGPFPEDETGSWRASGRHGMCFARPGPFRLAPRGICVAKVAICSSRWARPLPSVPSATKNNLRDLEIVLLGLRRDGRLREDICPELFHVLALGFQGSAREEMRARVPQAMAMDRCRERLLLLGNASLAKRMPILFQQAKLSIPLQLNLVAGNEVVELLDRHIRSVNRGSRFFTTNTGLIGTSVEGIYVGDVVYILYGAITPFILRQVGNKGHYKVFGEYYVSSLMYGEGLGMGKDEQDFVLI